MKITLCSNRNDFAHNTKYMFEYLLEHKSKYDIRYVIDDDAKRERLSEIYGNRFISTKSKEGLKFLKESNVWLLDGGMPTKNIFNMRNKVIINFWHGVPIKKVGINGYRGINKIRMFIQLKIFSYFINAYITTSENLIDIMAQSFMLSKDKIKVLGQPRNDYLANEISKEKLSDLYDTIDTNSKFVLYAPTWRKSKYGTSMKESVRYFPFNNFEPNNLNDFLREEKITIFVRPHSLEKIDITELSNIKILDNKLIDNVNDILNVFDLLISDYSGIFVDYLLLDKPIMLIPYDLKEYSDTKGLNFDFDKINPGPNIEGLEEFKANLVKLINEKEYYRDSRVMLNEFFNSNKGKCMPQVLELINIELEKK